MEGTTGVPIEKVTTATKMSESPHTNSPVCSLSFTWLFHKKKGEKERPSKPKQKPKLLVNKELVKAPLIILKIIKRKNQVIKNSFLSYRNYLLE